MNWFNILHMPLPHSTDLATSILYDENTFYKQFSKDLLTSTKEIIIESPFISTVRMKQLRPIFKKLISRGVKVYVFTRDPKEHSEEYEIQSETEIHFFEVIGVQVFICVGNHHRKLAILDRKILWEGSLNILSQVHSREIMRRIDSQKISQQTFNFLHFSRWIY